MSEISEDVSWPEVCGPGRGCLPPARLVLPLHQAREGRLPGHQLAALPLVSPGHVTCSPALIGHLLRRPVDGGVGGARGGELAHGGAVQPLARDVHPEQRGVAAVVTLEYIF